MRPKTHGRAAIASRASPRSPSTTALVITARISLLYSSDPWPRTRASHARQMGEVLQAAILALPEGYRETLILRDVEGLSAEEAAKVVGIEVRALKSRLHRARMQLREHLSTLLGEEAAAGGQGCPELAQELSEYAAQDIDQATCVRIEDHLGRCPRCAEACESLKRTVSLCRRIPGDAVPAPVRAAVRQALHGAVVARPSA